MVATQYHAQDELGHVEYGYSNPNSQKQESRDAYGNVHGAYRQEPNSISLFMTHKLNFSELSPLF